MNTMKYKGYVAHIEFDDEDRILVGHLSGIDDIVGFHGGSVDELETAFHEAVDNYLSISEKTGRSPQFPSSEQLVLRLPPEIHAAVSNAAQGRGKSVDEWASEVLGNAANPGFSQ